MRESMIFAFVSLRLAYSTKHSIFQLCPSCYKRGISFLFIRSTSYCTDSTFPLSNHVPVTAGLILYLSLVI